MDEKLKKRIKGVIWRFGLELFASLLLVYYTWVLNKPFNIFFVGMILCIILMEQINHNSIMEREYWNKLK